MERQGVGRAGEGRWPKGVSGNKDGRPRTDPQINGMLRIVRQALLGGARVTIHLPDAVAADHPAAGGGAWPMAVPTRPKASPNPVLRDRI